MRQTIKFETPIMSSRHMLFTHFAANCKNIYLLMGSLFFYFWTTAVHADIRLSPSISAGYTYTDNVFLDPEDQEYDLITEVGPGAELTVAGRFASSTITYIPTYASYSRFPENTTWRHDARFEGWVDIARGTRLELTNDFLRTEDPIAEIDTIVRQSREPYYTNTTAAGLVNHFGTDDVAELHYEYFVYENEDQTIEDSTYQRPSLLLTYWFSPNRFAMEVEGQYTVRDYDVSQNSEQMDARIRAIRRSGRRLDIYVEYTHVIFDNLSEGEDYQIYAPVIGFIWREQAYTLFSSSFGYFFRDNESLDDDDGIVGNVEMIYTYSGENTFTFTGSAGYDRSSFDTENLGFSTFYEIGATVAHRLSPRFTATLNSSYRGESFIDQSPNREDITKSAGAGMTFQASPWMQVNLLYFYREIDSTEEINDYIENRCSILVRLAPRQPFRF